MFGKRIALGLAALALGSGSACAMNASPPAKPRCSVAEGSKLPPESGGVEALCAEIEAATASLPVPPVVVVTRAGPYFLSASITVGDGQPTELNFSRSDKAVDREAFKRFAQSVARTASKPQP